MVKVLRDVSKKLRLRLLPRLRGGKARGRISPESVDGAPAAALAYWEFCYPFACGSPLFPQRPQFPFAGGNPSLLVETHTLNTGNFAQIGEEREVFFTALALLQNPPLVSNVTIRRMTIELSGQNAGNVKVQQFLSAVKTLQAYWELRSEALLVLGSIARREGDPRAVEMDSLDLALRNAVQRADFVATSTEVLSAVPVFLSAIETLLQRCCSEPELPLRRLRLLQKAVSKHLLNRSDLHQAVSGAAERIYAES